MKALALATEPVFAAGKPQLLFEDPYLEQRCFIANYDVNPNGNTFVMDPEAETKLNAVLDWAPALNGTR